MNHEQIKQNQGKNSHGLIWLVIILIVVFLGLVGGGLYYYFKVYKASHIKSLTLSDQCPKNIPIYPKSKIIAFTCKPEASSIESVINVKQTKVKTAYKSAIEKNGWTIRGEDSASYLFDNNTEIGKISLSTEKKNTVVKFLTAKKTATAPVVNNSSSSAASKAKTSGGLFDSGIFASLLNWEDYFNSIPSDYTAPNDDWEYFSDEAIDESDSSGTDIEEDTPEDTPEDITDDSTDTPSDDTDISDPGADEDAGNSDTPDDSGDDTNDGWNDKYYLQVPTN